jgi:hypothetical protein
MFKKFFGLVSLVGLVGAGSMAACTTETTTSTPKADSGTTTDAGVKKDGSTTTTDGGNTTTTDGGNTTGPACYDESTASGYDPAKATVAAQKGACTDATIAAGKTACLGQNATKATCDAFTKDNAACAGCLFSGGKDASGKAILPAVVPFGDTSVIPNTEACAAVVLKNEATCGMAYVNETTCLLSACQTCAASADLNACVDFAADNVCSPAVVDPNGACGKALTAGKAQVDAACTGTAFDDTFAKVAAVLCK